MITTTLGQLVNAEAALAELAKQRLPAKTAYQISKMLRLVPVETKHFYERKNALIQEMGTVQPATAEETAQHRQPQTWRVSSDQMPAFLEKLNELAEIPIELACDPVPLSVLGEMSAADLLALGALIDTGEEKPASVADTLSPHESPA